MQTETIFLKIFMLKYFRGYLDPQKLIELKINLMNIFQMKISQTTVGYNHPVSMYIHNMYYYIAM